MSIDVKALAREVCYGATGKVRAEFISLARANGCEGRAGGWIYRAGSAERIAQGWTWLAHRVMSGAITLRTVDEIVEAAHAEALDMNGGRSAIGRDATAEAPTPEEIRTAAVLAVAEVRAAIPVPTPEEFRARLRGMGGTPAMPAMPATPVPAPLYCLATDRQWRTHIMRAGCTLCGEPARLRRPIANGDVSRVDCLACLDRYTEETRTTNREEPVMAKRERKTCPSCGGRGSYPCPCTPKERHTKPCTTCGGTGSVYV